MWWLECFVLHHIFCRKKKELLKEIITKKTALRALEALGWSRALIKFWISLSLLLLFSSLWQINKAFTAFASSVRAGVDVMKNKHPRLMLSTFIFITARSRKKNHKGGEKRSISYWRKTNPWRWELFFQAISKVLLIWKEIKSDLLNLIFVNARSESWGVGANKNHLECARNWLWRIPIANRI